MRGGFVWLLNGLIVPIAALAQNSTSSNGTTSQPDGILSSGAVDLGVWADAYAKATSLVSKLTNNEKISVITGRSVTALNWTSLAFKDGTQGVQGNTTAPHMFNPRINAKT